MMNPRKSGIDFAGDLYWGSHLCLLYENHRKLIDIVVPYLKAGWESNEFCIWICPSALPLHEAKQIVNAAISQNGSPHEAIQVFDPLECYFRNGEFQHEEILNAWTNKLEWALANGFQGLRVAGDADWVTKKISKEFSIYEAAAHELILNERIIALCSYPASENKIEDIVNVSQNHHSALVEEGGKWLYLHNHAQSSAELALRKSHDQLEKLIQERTAELSFKNQELIEEVQIRKQIEEALQRSQELFLKAFRCNPSALCISQLDDGRILDANNSFVELFGYEREEVLGKTAIETGIWNAPQVRAEMIERLKHTGNVSGSEVQMRTKSGALRDVMYSAEIIEWDGKTCILVSLFDITESKRSKNELAESEERFRTLIESSFDGVAIHDGGKLLEVNDAFCRIFGYEREELIGESAYKLISVDYRSIVQEKVLQNYRKPYEITALKKDGSRFHVEGIGRACPYRGREVRVIAVRDITERKRAEETIQSLASLTRKLSQKLEINLLIDELAREAIRIVNADSGFVSILERGGLVCHEYFDHYGVEPIEYSFSRGHGLPGWVLIHQLPYMTNHAEQNQQLVSPGMDGNSGITAALCVPVTDIHSKVIACIEVHRKKGKAGFSNSELETMMAVAQAASIALQNALDYTKVQQAEQTLREFSKNIILSQEEERWRVSRDLHDSVNQILSSAKFSLQSLDEKSLSANPQIEKQVRRAHLLLEQAIQEIRMISSNLRQTVLDDLGLLPAVRTLCEEFEERTGKAVDLESLDVPDDLSSELQVTLFRIIQEALTNIEKHSEASAVKMRLVKVNSEIEVVIKDDGKGFEPARSLNIRSNEGLGLRNMKERVGLIGGRFDLQSIPGTGTEVFIRVPLILS